MKKFIVSSKSLLVALNKLSRVVNMSTVLPILENVLIDADDLTGKLWLHATDLETYAQIRIDAEIRGTFKTTIRAKELIEMMKNCEEQPITFVIEDSERLSYGERHVKIIGDEFEVKLPVEDAGNFPKSPAIETEQCLVLPAKSFLEKMKHALTFISNDDLRPAMTGVFLHSWRSESLRIVGTDAHRLYWNEIPVAQHQQRALKNYCERRKGMIVPRKPISVLCAWAAKSVEEIPMFYSDDHVQFSLPETIITTRLIDANYPDYNVVFPETPHKFIVFRKKLIAFLKMAMAVANKSTNQIEFVLDPTLKRISIETKDIDFSMEGSYRLAAHEITIGSQHRFAMNAAFIIQALSLVKDDYVEIAHSESSTRAVVIDKQVLTMPLMLNN